MRWSYTKRVSLDLQTLFWLMVLVAMTTRKLAKRKTNMFFLWGKLFNKRSAPYPTKMQNPALQKKKTIKIIYPQHKSRHYMSTLYSSKLNWRSFSVLQYLYFWNSIYQQQNIHVFQKRYFSIPHINYALALHLIFLID